MTRTTQSQRSSAVLWSRSLLWLRLQKQLLTCGSPP
jgi:hypothetical protein